MISEIFNKTFDLDDKIEDDIEESNFNSIAVYEYLYGGYFQRISYYVVLILILLVGPFLSITIVFYEYFGSDRQKRTILNRLSSHIFLNIAINSVIWSILRILRDTLGLLNTSLITPVALFSGGIWISSTLFITELTVSRFLYIVIWKRLRAINDDFWNCVVLLSNILVAVYFCIGIHLCGSHGYDTGYIIDVIYLEEKRYFNSCYFLH